jgi:hypothetical protein
MKMRLIDADALKEAISKHPLIDFTDDDIFELIDNAPTVFDDKAYSDGYAQGTCDCEHAHERPQGEWINTRPPEMSDNIVCSLCGYDSIASFNYCPNCGANMKGGAE